MCLCVNCAIAIQNQTSRTCPVCRDGNKIFKYLQEYFIDIESFIKLTKHSRSPSNLVPKNSDMNNIMKTYDNGSSLAQQNKQMGLNQGDSDMDQNFFQ